MEDLKELPLAALVDMLASHTSDYLRILRNGGTKEEYDNCKRLINRLTTEIELRRKEVDTRRGSGDRDHNTSI